jgi:hypothetical protein
MQFVTILVQMKFHMPHFNVHPTVADIVGSVVLAGLVAWTFWVLLQMVPYHEIPFWML